mmetsp:Transcript_13857/g.34992  ORF Transcript_13857/g.34992 Transcript_13857/m.34992 type:complete len:272 (+) Transcript_13857:1466-2281(+)
MVKLQRAVVQVHRVEQLRVARKVVLVELEDRQVLQHDVLHGRHVGGAHPELGRGAHKALRRVLVLLGRHVAAEVGVDVAQLDKEVGVVAHRPRLVVEDVDEELVHGLLRQVLVVLLQDLVESHVVEVHILLQLQELVAEALCLLLVRRSLVAVAVHGGGQAGHVAAEGLHHRLHKLGDLVNLLTQQGAESLMRALLLGPVRPLHGERRHAQAVRGTIGALAVLLHRRVDQVLEFAVVQVVLPPLRPRLLLQVDAVLHPGTLLDARRWRLGS